MSDFNMSYSYNFVEPDSENASYLTQARLIFSLTTPMIAYQLFNCNVKFAEDPFIRTAAATIFKGVPTIVLDTKFFKSLPNNRQRAFILFHEVMHIYAQHLGRQSDRGYNPKLWNYATDYYINYIALGYYKDQDGETQQFSRYKENFEFIEGGLLDTKYVGMSSDQIYASLIDEHGSAEKALEALGCPEDGSGTLADSDGSDGPGKGLPYDVVSSEEVSSDTKGKINRISASAVSSAEKSNRIGDNEGQLKQTFQDLYTPKINWKDQLSENVKAAIKTRQTYNRLSRRTSGSIVFPSYDGDSVSLVVGIDTSGSMGHAEITEGLTELYGILEQYDSWKIHLISCDTKAHVIGQYCSEDGDDFSTIDRSLVGGGGTDLQGIIDYSQEVSDLDGDIQACVIFTDGFLPKTNAENKDFETLMVVSTGGNKSLVVPGAKMIFMDNVG